ncbi:ROK family transcriptional regulator [Bifidobacterium adolescentis]|uniref:ROK family transcriptional regulator n=1 Tax=Bifidobacterium adolescentis TaxID=1680 RepID=UPI003D055943
MSRYSAQQSSISENNRSRILQYLYHNGICSRAQIAKAIKLTPAAITKITAKLLAQGIIEETGDMEGDKNRRSIGLNLNCAKYHIIGVKFARSLVQIAVFDLKCNRIFLTDLPTVNEEHIHDTVEHTRETINQLLKNDPEIVAIGMAVPGPYLKDEGRTALVSSMQGWRQINLIKEFSNAFSVPAFVEQDARAGALAQFLFDPELSEGSLAYYLLGEGIGLGVIDNGSIYYGELGTATEIGHVSIDVNGRPCDCGNIGCLERYCSANTIHEYLDTYPNIIPGSGAMTHAQACEALFTEADMGNETAVRLVRKIARYVGYGAVTIINTFNPKNIILGDIVAQAGQPLLDEVKKVVAERTIPEIGLSTRISLSTLPTDATVTGAAAVAITNFLEHPSIFFDVA